MRELVTILLLAPGSLPAAPPTPALDLSIGPTTRLLVLAPHPDDEALAASGLIRRVMTSGGTVRIVVVTSGDAFAEGVEKEDDTTHPTPAEYRSYGAVREQETIAAMQSLGVDRSQISFLGFPDDGLCRLASTYLSSKRHAYESPFTDRENPPAAEQVIRGVQYRGADVRAEIERVITDFAPTVLVLPDPTDEHPDHCSTHIFGREALADAIRQRAIPRPRVLHYLIHYERWPLSADAGVGPELFPPADFPPVDGQWRTLDLTPAEAAAKRRAIRAYPSQTQVIGPFMQGFGRTNELFLEGEPASPPECWCDADSVATDPPSK